MRLLKIQLVVLVTLVVSGCITTKNLDTKPATGSISGKVVDADSGQPLPGVNVILIGTDIGTATAEEGHYLLSNLPVGNYDFEYSLMGYSSSTLKAIKIAANKKTTANVKLKLGEIKMQI